MAYTGSYKLGIGLMGGTGLSPREHISLLASMGWDGFFTGWNRENLPVFRAAADEFGMIWQSIHAPFHRVRPMWDEGDEGKAVTEELLACLGDCAAFGVPVMVLHPFIGFGEHTPTRAGLANFGRLIERADGLGVRLAFENVEGEEYLAAIFREFEGHPSLGFCFDTGHELCYNRGKDMLAQYGGYLCHTHFNDNLGVTEEDIFWTDDLHLLMGDGIGNFPDVMERIRKTDYDGPLMCELTLTGKPGRHGEPVGHTHDGYAAMGYEAFYRHALERMRQITQAPL